jgi:hypothetical protein
LIYQLNVKESFPLPQTDEGCYLAQCGLLNDEALTMADWKSAISVVNLPDREDRRTHGAGTVVVMVAGER